MLSPSVAGTGVLVWEVALLSASPRNDSPVTATTAQLRRLSSPPSPYSTSMAVWSSVGLMLISYNDTDTNATATATAGSSSPAPSSASSHLSRRLSHLSGVEYGDVGLEGEAAAELQRSLADTAGEGEVEAQLGGAKGRETKYQAAANSGAPLAVLYLQAIARPYVGIPLLIYAA